MTDFQNNTPDNNDPLTTYRRRQQERKAKQRAITLDPQAPPPDYPAMADCTAAEALTASSLTRCSAPVIGAKADIVAMRDMLQNTLESDDTGKALLARQAVTLDALFHRLLTAGLGGTAKDGTPLPSYLNTDYLALALKAQAQSGHTTKAMNAIAYMAALRQHTPTPLNSDEQTEDGA